MAAMFTSSIQITKFRFTAYLILAFLVGLLTAQQVAKSLEGPVPGGNWISIWTGSFSSLQLNTSTMDVKNGVVTSWIREDRQKTFTGLSGASGRTIISKVSIDCTSRTVGIAEQRSFDAFLGLNQQVFTESTPKIPSDLMTGLLTLLICGQNQLSDDLEKHKFTSV